MFAVLLSLYMLRGQWPFLIPLYVHHPVSMQYFKNDEFMGTQIRKAFIYFGSNFGLRAAAQFGFSSYLSLTYGCLS